MANKPLELVHRSAAETAEIVPSGALVGIHEALGNVQDDLARIPEFKTKAEAIEVVDQASFLEAGTLQVQVEAIGGKDGGSRLQPFFDLTNTVLTFLRNKRSTVQAEKDAVIKILSDKRNAWAKKDREAKEKEQRELDAKNRKAGAPKQYVVDSVPVTAGKRKVTTWPITIEDADKFLKAWSKATGKEKDRLRQFILLDSQALGKESRDMQDPEAFMKLYPGIKSEKKESV
jgi:hypothetical protein